MFAIMLHDNLHNWCQDFTKNSISIMSKNDYINRMSDSLYFGKFSLVLMSVIVKHHEIRLYNKVAGRLLICSNKRILSEKCVRFLYIL